MIYGVSHMLCYNKYQHKSKFVLAKSKALDVDEMKGLKVFINHVERIAQKISRVVHKE